MSKWTDLVKKYSAEVKAEEKLKGIAIGQEAIRRAKEVYQKEKEEVKEEVKEETKEEEVTPINN